MLVSPSIYGLALDSLDSIKFFGLGWIFGFNWIFWIGLIFLDSIGVFGLGWIFWIRIFGLSWIFWIQQDFLDWVGFLDSTGCFGFNRIFTSRPFLKTVGGIVLGSVAVSTVSADVLPYISVAIKASFLKLGMCNICKNNIAKMFLDFFKILNCLFDRGF